jgi:hypothetical protein
MPGDELMQDYEPPETDVTGISNTLPNFSNFLPQGNNFPPVGPDSPQGSDVRANIVEAPQEEPGFFSRFGSAIRNASQVATSPPQFGAQAPADMPQEQPGVEEPGFFSKLGGAIRNATSIGNAPPQFGNQTEAQAPPIETAQVDAQEGLPVQTASEQEAAMQQQPPVENQPVAPQEESPPQENKEPMTYAEPGALNSVLEDPAQREEFERLTGVNITPEIQQQANAYEKILKTLTDEKAAYLTRLTESEKEIRDRIQSQTLTGNDKLLMAIALIAPALLAGALGGKEAFLGALAGGTGQAAKVLEKRDAETKDDQHRLDDIALSRLKAEKETMNASKDIEIAKAKALDSIPNKDLKELFQRDGRMLGKRFVLPSGNPLLPIESTRLRSMKDYDHITQKVLPKISEKVGKVESALGIIDKMDTLMDLVQKSQQEGLAGGARKVAGGIGYGTIARGMKAAFPNLRDEFVDKNGNDIKFETLYNTYRQNLYDEWRQIAGGTQSAASQEQFDQMIGDPFRAAAFWKGESSLAGAEQQINAVKENIEKSIKNDIKSAGFATEPIEELFANTGATKKKSEEKRKSDKANAAADKVIGKK